MPLAEECGLIRAIDEWALERALSQAGAWQRTGGACGTRSTSPRPGLAQGVEYLQRLEHALVANGIDGSSRWSSKSPSA